MLSVMLYKQRDAEGDGANMKKQSDLEILNWNGKINLFGWNAQRRIPYVLQAKWRTVQQFVNSKC